MRTITWLFVWCSVVLSSGCAIWENETSNRGGYLDYLADRHWLKADSKSMRALRAFAIQVSLARIASVSAKNDSDRQLLAIRLGATTKRFLPIYYCAFERNPLAVSGAKRDPCFYYDSAMVDYSTALFDLAMVALPVEDAKKLLNSVTGIVSGGAVNPLNIADLLESLVALGKDALKYGRVVGGLYRDTVELEVQVWLATPGIDRRPLGTRVTEADVFALREVYDRKSDNMPAWIAAVDALRARGLEPVPHSKFFDQLGGLMRYICDLITTEAEASNACKVGLPTTLPPPMSALGTLKVSRVGSIRTSGLGDSSSGLRPSGPKPPPGLPAAALTCPPAAQADLARNDDNVTKLQKYLMEGRPDQSDRDATFAQREQRLRVLLQLPAIKRLLASGRSVTINAVVSAVGCEEVRKLVAAEAKTRGLVE